MKIEEIFSQNLRCLRKQRGLTQAQLAELLNVTVITVQGWENLRSWPKANHIDKIAELFKICSSQLFLSSSHEVSVDGINQDKTVEHLAQKIAELGKANQTLASDLEAAKKFKHLAELHPDLPERIEYMIEKFSNLQKFKSKVRKAGKTKNSLGDIDAIFPIKKNTI